MNDENESSSISLQLTQRHPKLPIDRDHGGFHLGIFSGRIEIDKAKRLLRIEGIVGKSEMADSHSLSGSFRWVSPIFPI